MKNENNVRTSTFGSLSKVSSLSIALGLLVLIVVPFQANAIRFGTIDTTHTFVGALIVNDCFTIAPCLEGHFTVACTGSLVSPRVFLTAGHCPLFINLFLGGFSSDRVFVSFATNVIAKESWRSITGQVTHPDFQIVIPALGTYTNDYAAVILANPVTGITPGTVAPVGYLDSLKDSNQLQGTSFSAVGYGMDENFQIDGSRKITSTGYQALQTNWLFVSENSHTGNSGPCIHDSGSPALRPDGSNEYIVGTLTGFGDGSGPNLCNMLMIYNRVDTTNARDFIFSVIAANG